MTSSTSTAAAAAFAIAKPPPGDRPYDITVFGCTGNAGRAVAYHALRSAIASKKNGEKTKKPLRVALAGRSRDKVERTLTGLLTELEVSKSDMDVSIVIADASDASSMLEMAKSSKVVASCAGPYGRYGEAAVIACIKGKAHYLDITGEVDWVERMVNDHGTEAEEAGVTLLPFSGYDCVPAELGMALVGEALKTKEAGEEALGEVNLAFRSKGGGFPRGTINTIIDGIENTGPKRKEGDVYFYPKEYRQIAKDALAPSGFLLPKWSSHLGTYTGPNFMSVVNVPILCRTASTIGYSSNHLVINDRSVVSGPPSLLNGYGLFGTQLYIGVLVVVGLAFGFPPVRWWLKKKLPTYSYNGEPNGKVFLDAEGVSSSSSSSKTTAMAHMVVPGDPGIYSTGLFANAVANALLEATTASVSDIPRPLAGFHPPVAGLHRSGGESLLVRQLQKLGATVDLKVFPGKEGAEAIVLDAAKLQSKL